MILTLNLKSTVSPQNRINKLWSIYLWYFYEKNKFNIVKAAEEAGVKVYFFKNQLRLNPMLVRKSLQSTKKIYRVRNEKSKLELLIEDMLVKSKDPRSTSAYKYGTFKTRREIDIILENNNK